MNFPFMYKHIAESQQNKDEGPPKVKNCLLNKFLSKTGYGKKRWAIAYFFKASCSSKGENCQY